ncbi:MAG: ATP-binding protein [bacterium]|nr:ATP-binding protein [bacterium]
MTASNNSDSRTEKFLAERVWLKERVLEAVKAGAPMVALVSEPGMGKTLFLKSLLADYPGSVYVQIRRPLGTNTPEGFWRAVDAQLPPEKIDKSNLSVLSESAAKRLFSKDNARLLIIDSLERAPELLDSSGFAGLDNIAGFTVVIGCRPGAHLDALSAGGAEFIRLDPTDARNIEDISSWINKSVAGGDSEICQAILDNSGGNFLVASHLVKAVNSGAYAVHDLAQTPESLDEALAAMWDEILDNAPAEINDDIVRIACIFSECGEPLPAVSIADFLGYSSGRVRRALAWLRPILTREQGTHLYKFFNSRMANLVSRRFRRDLVQMHERIITFFREAYPSWEEMDDPYGWFYLGHHCDRLSRTSRRRDFSTLHWLGEGPYIKAKLAHTQSLSAVLQDLQRCLRAALEERNLPRIVGYGLRIPRLRAKEAANGLHDLADLGKFDLAIDRAKLLKAESSRFKAMLLLAWQALEEGREDEANTALRLASETVLVDFVEEDRLLLAYILADLLLKMPANVVLAAFQNCRFPQKTASVLLRVSFLEKLPFDTRINVVKFALKTVRAIEDEEERKLWTERFNKELAKLKDSRNVEPAEINAALVGEVNAVNCDFGSNEAMKNALANFAAALENNNAAASEEDASKAEEASEDKAGAVLEPQEAFHKALEAVGAFRWEPRKAGAIAALTRELVKARGEVWSSSAFIELISLIMTIRQPEERQRAAVSVIRIITGQPREIGWRDIFVRLGAVIESLESPALRVRAWAWLSLARFEARDFKGAQDVLNHSAALAFHISDTEDLTRTLAILSSCAAAIGNSSKARDLAYHSLQTAEAPAPNRVDVETRAAMVVGVSANVSEERSREYLEFSIEAARKIPDMRVRASLMAALAGGLSKLGEEEWARKVQDQAIGVARAMEPGAVQSKTLASLAIQEYSWGDVPRADKVIREAEQIARMEPDNVLRREALLTIATSKRFGGDEIGARAIIREIMAELEKVPFSELSGATDLYQLAGLVNEPKSCASLVNLLKHARKGVKGLSPKMRDEAYLLFSQSWLMMGMEDQARADLAAIENIEDKVKGRIFLAKRLIKSSPDESLDLLSRVPIFEERMRGVRECVVELLRDSGKIRRSEIMDTLARLTLIAVEDEVTADVLVSRWVNIISDRKAVLDCLGKLGYPLEDIVAGRVSEAKEME